MWSGASDENAHKLLFAEVTDENHTADVNS